MAFQRVNGATIKIIWQWTNNKLDRFIAPQMSTQAVETDGVVYGANRQ